MRLDQPAWKSVRRWLGVVLAGVVVLTLAPTGAVPAHAATLAETEPNGTMATADTIALGDTITGSSLTSSYSDSDYYAVDLPSAGRLALNLTFPSGLGTGNAYDVTIYNADGTPLYDFTVTANRYDGTWLTSQGTHLPAGRLYIRIYAGNSRATWGKTYTLTPGFTARRVELEPNSTTATATTVPLGATVSGSSLTSSYSDSDYYAVDLPSAGRLALNLTFPSGLGTGNAYDVTIYNADGTPLYDFTLTGGHSSGSWLAAQPVSLAKGRSYIRIYAGNSRSTWGQTYTLNTLGVLTATPTPTISGTAKVGKKLTAKAGTWKPAPVKVTYQWLRNGKAISKATKSTYKLVKADKKKKISVKVTGSKATYQSVSKTSASKTIK